MSSLPLIAVPHPVAGNDRNLVRAKANAIASEIMHALIDPADVLAARYRDRFLRLTERRLEGGAVCVDASCAYDASMSGTEGR